jgi:tRNA(fMet)-specific endonuclease VapC
MLLLDTNVISDFVRGHGAVMQRLRACAPEDLAISAVTRMEVAYGLARNPPRAERLAPLLGALFASVVTLDYAEDDAIETGKVRAELEACGRPIGLCDAMLAGVARARGLRMVTHNTAEFSRVAGLQWEDWRTPA